MATEAAVHTVRATHNFIASNNDELCFKKGDIITVTQAIEGGWWEGTLNDVTGWFPSNYVKELKHDSLKMRRSVPQQQEPPLSPKSDNMKMYREIVFKDIVDTESNHLNELRNLIVTYLIALNESNILNGDECTELKSNIEEVCASNLALLNALEDTQEKLQKDQRIGGAFIQLAPQIKQVNLYYCTNHPKAAKIIEKHKDELEKFMEESGAPPPGILTLTTGLSSPFRRLEKYPALLQELQRHTEESHIDRGDTQRAIFVYRDIAAACLNIRRQKENELEVMSGNIRGWEGEDIQTLGEIIHMGLVVFLTEDQEKKDRYLVVFPENLVILSVSPRISAFTYEGKLPMSGIKVKKLEPTESYPHAFEITGSMIQRIVVICSSLETFEQWILIFHPSTAPEVQSRSSAHPSPSHVAQRHVTSVTSATSVTLPLQTPLPSPPGPNLITANNQPLRTTNQKPGSNKIWSSWCLKPHPPMQPNVNYWNKGESNLHRNNSRRKDRVPDEKNYEGDMQVLQVIEAYCSSAKSRYTLNSALLEMPPVLIPEEEKIMVEAFRGGMPIIEEKSLVDSIYALKDEVQELKCDTAQLFKSLEDERKARERLEILVQKHLLNPHDNLPLPYFDD